MTRNHKIFVLSLILFVTVFISFLCVITHNWFWVDDLGVILNGLIKDVSSFIQVFYDDSRNYASTYNYNHPKPNFVSCLLRPIQQIFFSITYHLFGTNVLAYHVLQVAFYAANASLLFILCTYWLPLSVSFISALFLAFYPNVYWMSWICTLQHFLTLFFLLITMLLYIPLLEKKRPYGLLFYVSGFTFLLSLLSRETHMLLPAWAMLGVYWFYTNPQHTLVTRVKTSILYTSNFIVAGIIYVIMRIHAFGFASLHRTANNILMKIPFLKTFFVTQQVVTKDFVTQELVSQVATTPVTQQVVTQELVSQPVTSSAPITRILSKLQDRFFQWISIIFDIPTRTLPQKIFTIALLCTLGALLVYAYKRHRLLLLYLVLGLPLFVWPCVMLYPAHRYMNPIYPLLIFIIALGAYMLTKHIQSKNLVFVLFALSGLILCRQYVKHIVRPARKPHATHKNKEIEQFFATYTLPKKSHLILLSPKYESDPEQIFQTISQNIRQLNYANGFLSSPTNRHISSTTDAVMAKWRHTCNMCLRTHICMA